MDVNDALQALLAPAGLQATAFPPNSRYHRLETAVWETPGGATIIYLRRRWVPHPDRFVTVREYMVAEGDRLDNLANTFIGDPEQFWRLCDANGALHPLELEEIGRRLRITLPEGAPGTPNS